MPTLADGLGITDLRRLAATMGAMYHLGRKRPTVPVLPSQDLQTWRRLPWRSMIAGFAVAEKFTSHAPTGELCLRLYVRRKVAGSRLNQADRIPGSLLIAKGKQAIRLPTDVIEMPVNPVAHRELSATASIGSFTGVTDGTLGLAVIDRDSKRYLLTCSHVVLPWFRKPPVTMPDAIESPPDSDGNPGPNTIGSLHSWTPLVPGRTHTCDAALVLPVSGVDLSNAPLNLTPTANGIATSSPELLVDPGRRVQTYTRRRVLNGIIQSIQNNFEMTFLGKSFFFREAVEVLYDSPSMAGDSGAAVVQASTRQVLGLHFAAREGTNIGYFVPMQPIIKAFSSLGLQPL